MSDAPSWLNEDNAALAQQAAKNPHVQAAAVAGATSWANEQANKSPSYTPPTLNDVESPAEPTQPSLAANDEELKALGKYHLYVRVAYSVSAVFLGVAAGLSLVNQTDLGKIFFAFYVLFFALMICCFECGLQAALKFIAINFGFMYTLTGRIVFLLFIGFMSFGLSTIGIAAMCFLYVVGGFHFYVLCKYPKYETYVREKHYFKGGNY